MLDLSGPQISSPQVVPPTLQDGSFPCVSLHHVWCFLVYWGWHNNFLLSRGSRCTCWWKKKKKDRYDLVWEPWELWKNRVFLEKSSVKSLSHVWLFETPWTAACQASLSIINSQSLLKLMSIESVMPSTISSSVVPFSSCPQSFPASGSFQMCQLFASGSKSTGVSASTSVLPMNTQDWSPLGWTDWISL